MYEQQITSEHITFDQVRVGDDLTFNRRFSSWQWGTEIERRGGTVTRITANTIYTTGGYRLTRKTWYDAYPTRPITAA